MTEGIFNRKLTHFLIIALICQFLFGQPGKQLFLVFFFLPVYSTLVYCQLFFSYKQRDSCKTSWITLERNSRH